MIHVNTYKTIGIEAVPVICECEMSKGLGVHLVGLLDQSAKDGLLRTVTALQSREYHIPGKKIVINLAPADLVKSGTNYDLPIAISVIAESGQAEMNCLDEFAVIGELGLDASVRYVKGAVQICEAALKAGKKIIIPQDNALEVADLFGEEAQIYVAATLDDAIKILQGCDGVTAWDYFTAHKPADTPEENTWDALDGFDAEKRALEIAAAGGHHLFLMGTPGSQTERLARALLDILPPIDKEQMLETAKIYSTYGNRPPVRTRPIRNLYSATSLQKLVGGACDGNCPGEVSLANNGILCLDINNTLKVNLEALRGVLEDGTVTIARLRSRITFPARFQFVATALPCPCGYYGETPNRCTCTPGQRHAYLNRMNVALMDHIDLQVWCHPELKAAGPSADNARDVAARVKKARDVQMRRQGKLNAELTVKEMPNLSPECEGLVSRLIGQMNLSARDYTRILKIARTIADLDDSEQIQKQHLVEAAAYRFFHRMTQE